MPVWRAKLGTAPAGGAAASSAAARIPKAARLKTAPIFLPGIPCSPYLTCGSRQVHSWNLSRQLVAVHLAKATKDDRHPVRTLVYEQIAKQIYVRTHGPHRAFRALALFSRGEH